MRRGTLILGSIVLLVGAVGCHHNTPANDQPAFTTFSTGSTGDAMSHYAQLYGVPVYPNSTPDTAHFNAAQNAQGQIYLAYNTPDGVDKVVEFYKEQLHMSASEVGTVMEMTGISQNGNQVAINIGRDINGSRTNYTIQATSNQGQNQNQSQAAMNTTPAQPVEQPKPTPPPVPAAKDPGQSNTDTTTYDISTSNAPPDVTSNNGDQNQTGTGDNNQSQDNGQSNGQNNGQPQDQSNGGNGNDQQSTTTGPPG